MWLLQQADPVRRLQPEPTVDAVDYLDALRVRSANVTLTHTGLTAEPGLAHHRRWPVITVAAAVVAIVVGGLVLVARHHSSVTHIPGVPTTTTNGWVAFVAGAPYSDIYLVREGSAAQRIAGSGSETDGISQVCPAFSPDGTRLAYGETKGHENAHQDEALVITDLTTDGLPFSTFTIPLDGTSLPPCPIWSADGRWLAFGAGDHDWEADPQTDSEVWVIDTTTKDIRRLTGQSATDLEWAPDAAKLFIASDGIVVYPVATGESRPLADTAGVRSFTLSPDGHSIAFERLDPSVPKPLNGAARIDNLDLWVMDADGTGERILAADFEANHGLGPVWSPDGDHIVYQRLCDFRPPPYTTAVCREEHEVMVVTVNDNDPLEPAGTQQVISAETAGPAGTTMWSPFSVTWSPDSTTLLYLAW
jgi:Tol biopolymer transport system component